MNPNFKLPVRLNSDGVLEDADGTTIVPNFFYGNSDMKNDCDRRALFTEWWFNQYQRLMRLPEVKKELGIVSRETIIRK